jgi:hypothetical protein
MLGLHNSQKHINTCKYEPIITFEENALLLTVKKELAVTAIVGRKRRWRRKEVREAF